MSIDEQTDWRLEIKVSYAAKRSERDRVSADKTGSTS